MKKIFILLTALLTCTLLAACGAEKEPENVWMGIGLGADLAAITEREEYYDLMVASEELFALGLLEQNPEEYTIQFLPDGEFVYALLGTQFVMGEPAQIWSEVSAQEADVYLYWTDGSRELLLEGIPSEYAANDYHFRCYIDQERNCYFYRTSYPQVNGEYRQVGTIVKMFPSGEIRYENTLELGFIIEDICQTEGGRIYLLLLDYENNRKVVKELDPETGQLILEHQVELSLGDLYLGGADDFLTVAGFGSGGYGVGAVDMAAECTTPLLFFNGTSYGWHDDLVLQDFQVMEDGTIDFLWTDRNGLNCFRERMRMEKVEKTPIVLRGIFFADSWLSKQVALFNQKSSDYHVIMEVCGYGNDLENFSRLTSVQVGAGKGPDILCGDYLLQDYLDGMMDKGALEVLNPYMEASGIREENYFPLTFSAWRQGENIYGVTPKMEVYYEEMDAEVLGRLEMPDIEMLVEALLAWEGNGVYRKRLASGEVLNLFLQGSENLWGMVDWETGSCDFNTPLFDKLLEAARRYGYEVRRELEPEITYHKNLEFFFGFHSSAEQKEKGMVSVGFLFDDGCHAVSMPRYTMAVNANSTHKEGAWEFISFLLGEEVQDRKERYLPPVHRESFDKWLEWELNDLTGSLGAVYYGENTSKEKREEYKKAIEDAKPLPIRTASILTIVLEEAENYFNGSKSAEEVSKVINNRVQLYLNERK